MSDKMLIDASHQEETRVVVTRGNRIEEFDFESEHKKQLKGNIYLARVTRVEPSLQAAFVEYGDGNRHGFLAFSEIHPDYYQIPVADRQALLEDEARAAQQEQDAAGEVQSSSPKRHRRSRAAEMSDADEVYAIDAEDDEEQGTGDEADSSDNGDHSVEYIGAEDAMEEVPTHRHNHRRSYKIQEVIKRRQILLVQVVKEERGNKGAALTTYLSLAGRYSVLMPNTARGGGISRKIINVNDRKRLKDIVKELEVPKGMGVILRTAGANRTRTEIKRDYEYLIRLWENVRNLTLSSIAPALVHEEGNLIKRSIRDLYNKDIGEILVAGEHGYREAKDFMRMLMPSHAKVVQPYRDPVPIFSRNGIEPQLDRMLQPEANLKSGGYLVINQTEALVAIDVNSGRSTREHSVEEMALRTNLEAAEEVARQLRLRDLAGLVVIDFIDMAEKRNIRAVEKKLKDCLREDRARIQVGHISAFGLLEMSRQRLRASVLESTTQVCPHCHGTGYIRSPSSVALHVIRGIEEYLLRNNDHDLLVHTPTATALYVLNHKRRLLSELETRFGLTISLEADDTLGAQHFIIHQGAPRRGVPQLDVAAFAPMREDEEDDSAAQALEAEIAAEIAADREKTREEGTENNRNRRDKRRRNGRGNGLDAKHQGREDNVEGEEKTLDDETGEDGRDKKRRRGRRAGRRSRDFNGRGRLPFAEPVGPFAASALAALRHRKRARYAPRPEPVGPFVTAENFATDKVAVEPAQTVVAEATIVQTDETVTTTGPQMVAATPKRGRKPRAKLAAEAAPAAVVTEAMEIITPSPVVAEEEPQVKKPRSRRTKAAQPVEENEHEAQEVIVPIVEEKAVEEKPKKRKTTARKAKVVEAEAALSGGQDEGQAPFQPEPETTEEPKSARSRRKKAPVAEKELTIMSPATSSLNGAVAPVQSESVMQSQSVLQATPIEDAPIEQETPVEIAKGPVVVSSSSATEKKPKRGWWQRKSFF